MFLDGFCESNNTAYLFHGCYYHGCIECGINRKFVDDKSTAEVQRQTRLDEEAIRAQGYNLVIEKECRWIIIKQQNPALIKTCEDEVNLRRLNPSEALYGGRTSPAQMHVDLTDSSTEWIKYIDFCSLYPYVQKTGDYPVGVPDEIYGARLPTENEFMQKHEDYFGLVYCDVTPPNNLLFPILPLKLDKKLIFPLCLACAETKLNSNCTHNEDERTFYKKVYCTPELSYAIENGYIVKKIHEIWNFKRMKANSPNNGLFGNFISEAVKGKQEASGFPNGVETPQQKQEFI